MSEPKSDDGTVNTVLQEIHRCRVTKYVWSYPLACERGAVLPGGGYVLGDQAFDSVPAEEAPAQTRKKRIIWAATLLVHPILDHSSDILSERRRAVFSTFSLTAYTSANSKDDVLKAQVDEFGNPQARLGGNQQQRPVSASSPG